MDISEALDVVLALACKAHLAEDHSADADPEREIECNAIDQVRAFFENRGLTVGTDSD